MQTIAMPSHESLNRQVIEKEGVRVLEKFKAVIVEKWKDRNNNKDPVAEGYTLRSSGFRARSRCVFWSEPSQRGSMTAR